MNSIATTVAQSPLTPFGFPIAFVALWLGVTTILMVVSRWRTLQDRYPARDDPPLLSLHSQSGMIGWVSYRGCLTLHACRGGLRVSVWKLFAPFGRAIEVPWDATTPEPPRGWLAKRVKLHLGSPQLQVLDIGATSWARLAAVAPPQIRNRSAFPAQG